MSKSTPGLIRNFPSRGTGHGEKRQVFTLQNFHNFCYNLVAAFTLGSEVAFMSIPMELVQAVAAFVPTHVVQGIVDGYPPKPGVVTASEGAVIFADVAGFTPMAERLARVMRGRSPHAEPRGAEELNRIINGSFSAMMGVIQRYGGVITRFSGDALAAFFERPAQLRPSDVVASALSCAHAMQRAIKPFVRVQVEGKTFSVSVKIGVGYGPAMFLTIGDEDSDEEWVLAGLALEAATAAETHAGRGQVVLAPGAHALLPDEFSHYSSSQAGHTPVSNLQYRAVPLPERNVALLPPTVDPLAGLGEKEAERILRYLAPYLPRSIYDRVVLARGELPGDYRRISNLFVFFDGLDFGRPDVGEKAQAYYLWAHAIVDRYGGRMIRTVVDDKGASLHILFGAPDKYADDPVRALRCALALQREPDRPHYITRQRVGVASGNVFAGTIGSPTRREYTVVGNEVNLSARLTAVCPAGEVLVDVYTRDRTARQFEFETLPPMQLKGKSSPIIAHRLVAERPSEIGLAARYLASRWRIVGREAEVSALARAADDALGGAGRVIAIEGRAGVGKTRLTEEVVRHWLAQGGDGYVGQAVSHGANSPYHLWANFWHAFFDLGEADDARTRWRKVEVAVGEEAPDLSSWMGVLAPVLGLPLAETSLSSSLDAADRRRKLFEITLSLLKARARRQPLLVLFEDLHWADRPSLELVDFVSEGISHVPILMCICFRPREDFELEALSMMHCTWRILDELPYDHSAELVRTILGEVDLPERLKQEIYDKTQGNPLYVEEILNSFIASGILVPENGDYRLSADPAAITIPDTLQDLLMARIDRLEAPSRDLVQVASVINRRFPYLILRGIYPYPMSDLEMQERLNELIRPEDLTRLEQPEPDLVYLFKHALTRDVAYASLAFARRSDLHRRIGEFIEATYPDRLEEYYGTLAHHFDQSKQLERALNYALLAGIQAQEMYANEEALRYYQEVEGYLRHLPVESHWSDALRVALRRSVLHRLNGDYHLAEADLNRALELAKSYGDTRSQAEAYGLLADLRYYQMRDEESLEFAQQAHVIATANNHVEELNTALVQLGIAFQMAGNIERSMEYLQQARQLAEERGDRLKIARALNTMAIAWGIYQGNLDAALDGFERVLEIRREAGARDREAEILANIANLHFRRGDFVAALEIGQDALRVGRAAGWQHGISYVQLDQADVYCYLGDYETGRQLIGEAERNLVAGDELGQAYLKFWLGRNIHFDLGSDDLALPLLKASLELMQAHGHYEEEMLRALTALGGSLARLGQLAEARAYLSEGYEFSLTQNFLWQRSEVCHRLGQIALAEGRLDEADDWAQRAQAATGEGSSPDWLGSIHALLARIARQRASPTGQIVSLYQQAVSAAQARCRAVEKASVHREAGLYLEDHAENDVRLYGQALKHQADDWLAAHGISV